MDSYQVEIAETAMNDLLAISDHIAVALQAPLNAEKQVRRLMAAIVLSSPMCCTVRRILQHD